MAKRRTNRTVGMLLRAGGGRERERERGRGGEKERTQRYLTKLEFDAKKVDVTFVSCFVALPMEPLPEKNDAYEIGVKSENGKAIADKKCPEVGARRSIFSRSMLVKEGKRTSF